MPDHPHRQPAADRPPDLVLFLTDQQRGDQLGVADPTFQTPHLDALAARGVVFEQATSGSTVCVPARSSLLTGLCYGRAPKQAGDLSLPPGSWTVARALARAGYQTALVGKMHFSPIHADHGFEIHRSCEHRTPRELRTSGGEDDDYQRWLVELGHPERNGAGPIASDVAEAARAAGGRGPYPFPAAQHPTGWVGAEARRVLRERDPARPLLLVVSFLHPHDPHNPPEPYASRFVPDLDSVPDEDLSVNDGLPAPFRTAFTERRRRAVPREKVAQVLAMVRALVNHIDDEVGRILELVDPARTHTFFTSDHGDYAGHRGMLRKLPWIPFEDLVNVPLVAAGPGTVGGRRVRDPVQSFDLVPTWLELAGIPADPSVLSARSLVPHLEHRAGAAERERAVTSGFLGWGMIRRGPDKLIRRGSATTVLFDLDRDPGERVDRAQAPGAREVVEHLDRELSVERDRPLPDPEALP